MKVLRVALRAPSAFLVCALLLACFDISKKTSQASPEENLKKVWSVKLAEPGARLPGHDSKLRSDFFQGGGKVAFIGANGLAVTMVRECGNEVGPNMHCFFESLLLDANTGVVRKALKWDSNSKLARHIALINHRMPTSRLSSSYVNTKQPIDPHGFASSQYERDLKKVMGSWTMESRPVAGQQRLGIFWNSPPGWPGPTQKSEYLVTSVCWVDVEAWKEVRCDDGGGSFPASGRNTAIRKASPPDKKPVQWEIRSPESGWLPFPVAKNIEPVAILGDDLILLQSSKERLLETSTRASIMRFPGTGGLRVSSSEDCSRLAVLDGLEAVLPSCFTDPPGNDNLASMPCRQFNPPVQTSLSVNVLDVTSRTSMAKLKLGVSDWELSDVSLSPDGSHVAVLFNGTLTLYQVPSPPGAPARQAFCSATAPATRPPQ